MLESCLSVPKSIGQIAIPCSDVERATVFYQDVLGLPLLFAYPGLAFFQCGEVRLMLSKPSSAELDHPASPIYFRVDGIDEAMRRMQSAGARIHREAQLTHRDANHELWIGWFYDSEDNLLALMEERPVVGV